MSLYPNQPFIDLDRHFVRVEKTLTPQPSDGEGVRSSGQTYDWERLLNQRVVVILGEPGSGKTRELQEQADRLNKQGRTAFFVRLEQLAVLSWIEVVGPGQAEDFQRWKDGDEEAFFFLDSVDEAKLHRTVDFATALARFAAAVGATSRRRGHFFISSRVSEWRADADAAMVSTQLCDSMTVRRKVRDGAVVEARVEGLVTVRLEDLSRDQATKFATQIGTREPSRFVAEVSRAFAWEFMRRPADVIDLARYWNESGRLGTLTEIVQGHIRRNLRENPERDRDAAVTITEADAYTGAKALAAATAFCEESAFQVASAAGGLDPRDCLPANWSPEAVPVMLSRPLFDDASFGKRQFHQRRVVEFLTAEWVADRMRAGASLRSLRAMFFDETNGMLRPSLAAAAAWLCAANTEWGQEMRSWVLKAEPGIHLRFGDPVMLTSEYRRSLLHRIADAYSDRVRAWIGADEQALSRFATADLADGIATLFGSKATVKELRFHLMRMAALGRLVDCVDRAVAVLGDPTDDDNLRLAALEVVEEADGGRRLSEVAEIVRGFHVISERLGAGLIRVLYPRILAPSDLVALVAKIRDSNLPARADLVRRHLRENLESAHATQLMELFLALVQSPPHAHNRHGTLSLSSDHGDLAGVLPPIMEALLSRAALTDREEEALSLGLLLYGPVAHEYPSEENEAVAKATLRHLGVRRRYFKACIEIAARTTGSTIAHWFFWPLDSDAILHRAECDLIWLIEGIRGEDPITRSTCLHLALQLWNETGRRRTTMRRINAAAAGDPTLAAIPDQFVRGARLAPLQWWWRNNVTYRFGHRWARPRLHRWLRDRRARAVTIVDLNLRWRSIARGADVGLLAWLAREAAPKTNDRWTTIDWSSLNGTYGPLVTWAAKRGCVSSWRRYRPLAPADNPDPNRTSPQVIAGLNGLQLEWAAGPMAFLKMSPHDAEVAALYAVNELNAPPEWLDDLARVQPLPVSAALRHCISREWRSTHVYGVLAHALGRADGFGAVVRTDVLALLRDGDPQERQTLDLALRLLLPTHATDVARLAERRSTVLTPEEPATALWIAAWLRTDAEPALRWLEALPTEDRRIERLFVALCDCLHGGELIRTKLDMTDSFMRPALLRRLIVMVYQWVPQEGDRPHYVGVYTPNSRDRAEEFRNNLLWALAEMTDLEVIPELEALAEAPVMRSSRDYLRHLHEARVRRATAPAAWRPLQIRECAALNESEPSTDEELNRIVLCRLDDIKYAVESSDYSIRANVGSDLEETSLRHFIATELNRRSLNRYAPTQETEIDEAKRPDLRVENSRVTGPIQIEIKWAENWRVPQLLERLENQLVGTYLRATESHYGIFVLGMIGRKGVDSWTDPDNRNRKLHFREVVEIVRGKAEMLRKGTPGVRGLEVIAIDFRPPSERE